MTTGAAATGARSFVASRHFSWMTPRRMKAITAALLGSALLASSFIVSGSTPRAPASGGHASPAPVLTHAAR